MYGANPYPHFQRCLVLSKTKFDTTGLNVTFDSSRCPLIQPGVAGIFGYHIVSIERIPGHKTSRIGSSVAAITAHHASSLKSCFLKNAYHIIHYAANVKTYFIAFTSFLLNYSRDGRETADYCGTGWIYYTGVVHYMQIRISLAMIPTWIVWFNFFREQKFSMRSWVHPISMTTIFILTAILPYV